ncbi:MAG: RNA-binding protein, partial [Chitinophagaceae bacterium]|nr:RNA-binding protein [Chitinophagaceae bacterium]
GRHDAQGMLVLKGHGDGGFTVDSRGFNTASDNKAISSIQGADGSRLFLVSSNAGYLKAYRGNDSVKSIPLADTDVYAIITQKNGKKYKEEFMFGQSYISQSSRRLYISSNTASVTMYDAKGGKREIMAFK